MQVYGLASQASHLRPIVQEYNMRSGEIEIEQHNLAVDRAYEMAAEGSLEELLNPITTPTTISLPVSVKVEKKSEWADFVDSVESDRVRLPQKAFLLHKRSWRSPFAAPTTFTAQRR